MTFYSILFENLVDRRQAETPDAPACFVDLNLDYYHANYWVDVVFQTALSTTTTLTTTVTTTAIAHAHDPLSRLTDATYSNGQRFQYVYDEVGNRIAQTATITSTQGSTLAYAPLASNEVRQRITGLTEQPTRATVNAELSVLLQTLSKEQLSQAVIAIVQQMAS